MACQLFSLNVLVKSGRWDPRPWRKRKWICSVSDNHKVEECKPPPLNAPKEENSSEDLTRKLDSEGRDGSERIGVDLQVGPFLGSPAAELEIIIDFWLSALIVHRVVISTEAI
jgi:hypothetical protein